MTNHKNFKSVLVASLAGASLLASCVNVSRTTFDGRYKIQRKMFLTKEAYFPPAYPCGLSQFEFKGPDVHLIQRLGKIPVGTTVTIESAKVKTDLYSPQMLKIKGKVLFNAKLIGYNGTFTRDEFSDWFKKID